MTDQSPSVPPKIRTAPSFAAWLGGAVLGGVLLGAGALLFFFNPATHGFYPVCLFHELTGWNCPGCGGTRAAYALLHGHWEQALRDNALLVLLPPAAALRGLWLGAKKRLGRPVGPFLPVKALWPLLAAIVVFTVLRNLPAFALLSP